MLKKEERLDQGLAKASDRRLGAKNIARRRFPLSFEVLKFNI